jgi:chorismate dehydratase
MVQARLHTREPELSKVNQRSAVRLGAVTYLNTRPLTFWLPRIASHLQVRTDLPSRLADDLAAARLDVAVAPSIEYARNPGYTIVSDACVACDGPVRSVKLYSRVPAPRIRTLALDEGSRTSAAMAQILLKERFGLQPQLQPLPIGTPVEDSPSDATVVIGDRAILPPRRRFELVWDLGEEWLRWTGLPFVFAMWIARPGVDLEGIDQILSTARDEGISRLPEIARAEAPLVGIPEAECLSYLRDNLHFELGPRQRQGLELFFRLAGRHGLAPGGVKLAFCGQ